MITKTLEHELVSVQYILSLKTDKCRYFLYLTSIQVILTFYKIMCFSSIQANLDNLYLCLF